MGEKERGADLVPIACAIHLGEESIPYGRVGFSQSFPGRRERLAVAAPRRVKLDEEVARRRSRRRLRVLLEVAVAEHVHLLGGGCANRGQEEHEQGASRRHAEPRKFRVN